MKEKNPLDEFFKQGLEGHEIKPSASVWEKIENATQSESDSKRGGWFFMRAAVITLLLGLSTWFFYRDSGYESQKQIIPITQEKTVVNTDKGAKDDKETEKGEDSQATDKGEKKETPKKERKGDDVIPIMKKPGKSTPIFVSTPAALLEVIDEAELEREESLWAPEQIAINMRNTNSDVVPVKVKVRLTPATTPAFYANGSPEDEPENQGLKEKLYAYANTQFENLMSGKPLELPKTEKKPQLEIDLGRIFNR